MKNLNNINSFDFIRFINSKQKFILFSFLVLLIFSFILSLGIGSFRIPIINLINFELSDLEFKVLSEIRTPRVLLACLVGASLGISGASLQGLFRNPLADPGLIGVSAGAALGASFVIVLGTKFIPEFLFGVFILPISAISGASLVIFFLYAFTSGFGSKGTTYMLLIGIAINALASVIIGILTYVSTDSQLRGLTFWMMGSFGASNWLLITPAIILILSSILLMLPISRKIDVLQLGESEALRLGVDVQKLKLKVVLFSATCVGASVALSGMIGFVGLVVPHLVRLIGGVNHSYLLAGSAILGAALMTSADLLSRILIQPAELPVGLLTSAIGAPFFLWLIIKIKR